MVLCTSFLPIHENGSVKITNFTSTFHFGIIKTLYLSCLIQKTMIVSNASRFWVQERTRSVSFFLLCWFCCVKCFIAITHTGILKTTGNRSLLYKAAGHPTLVSSWREVCRLYSVHTIDKIAMMRSAGHRSWLSCCNVQLTSVSSCPRDRRLYGVKLWPVIWTWSWMSEPVHHTVLCKHLPSLDWNGWFSRSREPTTVSAWWPGTVSIELCGRANI